MGYFEGGYFFGLSQSLRNQVNRSIAIGIEIEEKYCEMSQSLLNQVNCSIEITFQMVSIDTASRRNPFLIRSMFPTDCDFVEIWPSYESQSLLNQVNVSNGGKPITSMTPEKVAIPS